MAQQNEPWHTLEPATVPAKRKRGRPRKEDGPISEPSRRPQRQRLSPSPNGVQGLVGQPISGVLDGTFDAGFLITVRMSNNGPPLKGLIFDPRLTVPVSAANDVAPQISMSRRVDVPIPRPVPAEPIQRQTPTIPSSSPSVNKATVNGDSHASALRLKDSESILSGTPSTVSRGTAPAAVQVPENPVQALTVGEHNLDSTRKVSGANGAAGEMKLISTTQVHNGNASADGLKLNCISQTTTANETEGQQKFGSTSQTPAAGNEPVGELKLSSPSQAVPSADSSGDLKLASESPKTMGPEVSGELKTWEVSDVAGEVDLGSAGHTGSETADKLEVESTIQKPPVTETTGATGQTYLGSEAAEEQKPTSASPPLLINEPVGETKPDSANQSFVTAPASMEAKTQNDFNQVQSSAPAGATEVLTPEVRSETLEEIKTDVI